MLERVKDLILYLTYRCNLRCRGCFVGDCLGSKTDIPVEHLEGLSEWRGLSRVNLMGGEPLLHPDYPQILEFFRSRGIKVTTSTNAIPLRNPKIAEEATQSDFLQISLESPYTKYNDELRGPRSGNKAMAGLLNVLEMGYPPERIYIRMGYCHRNLWHIPTMLEACKRHGMGLLLFPRTDEPPLGVTDQIRLFNTTLLYRNCKVLQPHYHQWLGARSWSCPRALRRLSIDPQGWIHPCHLDSYRLGRLWDDPETGIPATPPEQLQSEMESYRSRFVRIMPNCLQCSRASVCRSSCRFSRAYIGCPLQVKHTAASVFPRMGMEYADYQAKYSSVVNVDIAGC